MAAPGAPPVWSFGVEGESDLTVTVDKGSICIYDMESDQEVRLASTDELVDWLNERRPGSLQPQRGRAVDKMKRANFFKWE